MKTVFRRRTSFTRLTAISHAVAAIAMSPPCYAEAGEATEDFAFSEGFLFGSPEALPDIRRFHRGGAVVPGDYRLDLYVNQTWLGRGSVRMQAEAEKAVAARPCFDAALLDRIGVDRQRVPAETSITDCSRLEAIVPGAMVSFDGGEMRLDISVPQAYLRRNPRGYVDPTQWDDGIPALRLQYNANVYRVEAGGGASTQGYAGLNLGANVGAWRLRHAGNLTGGTGASTRYQAVQTNLQRAIVPLKSQLVLGDAFTDGRLFDSIGFRGVQLATDDRMLPDSQRGYAPILRGMARSNARVQVRQGGNLIYETTVSAGAFEISDLYPTGYGGDLEMIVTEADGSVSVSRMPYAAAVNALRPGVTRYSVTVGQYRNPLAHNAPLLAQATVQHGLNNTVTLYGGATAAQGYMSVLGGAAFNSSFGAFGIDLTQSWTRLQTQPDRRGTSVRLSYSKLISPTQTNLTLAAYRYSSPGYLGVADAMALLDLDERGLTVGAAAPRRGRLQVLVNQPLARGYGNVYLSGSTQSYWNGRGTDTQYQAGYNNSYGRISYGVSAYRQFNVNARKWETRAMLEIGIPLGRGPQAPFSRTSVQFGGAPGTSLQESVTGVLGQDNAFSYGVHASTGQNASVAANVGYISPVTTASLNASHGRGFHQVGGGISGGLLAYQGGVALSPTLGETVAVIEADSARGARVINSPGVRVDPWGRAIVSNLTPFARNEVELDPTGLPVSIQLATTQQSVAPTSGAVVKLQFGAEDRGQAALLQISGTQDDPIPFGAEVLDDAHRNVGTVVQGNRILAFGLTPGHGAIVLKWGEAASQRRVLHYRLDAARPTKDGATRMAPGVVYPPGIATERERDGQQRAALGLGTPSHP